MRIKPPTHWKYMTPLMLAPQNSGAPYTVEICLTPISVDGESWDEIRRFSIVLRDRDEASRRIGDEERTARGTMVLHMSTEIRKKSLGQSIVPRDFIRTFLRGMPLLPTDGLAFGQWLLDALLESHEVRTLWNECTERRDTRRPLNLFLILPRKAASRIDDLPFELLADGKGFLLRQMSDGGHPALTRSVQGLHETNQPMRTGDKSLFAWANPDSSFADKISAELIRQHEQVSEEAAIRLGLKVLPPCREATREKLKSRLQTERPVLLLTLLAHGSKVSHRQGCLTLVGPIG